MSVFSKLIDKGEDFVEDVTGLDISQATGMDAGWSFEDWWEEPLTLGFSGKRDDPWYQQPGMLPLAAGGAYLAAPYLAGSSAASAGATGLEGATISGFGGLAGGAGGAGGISAMGVGGIGALASTLGGLFTKSNIPYWLLGGSSLLNYLGMSEQSDIMGREADAMERLSNMQIDLYNQGQPMRDMTYGQLEAILSGKTDPSTLPMYANYRRCFS